MRHLLACLLLPLVLAACGSTTTMRPDGTVAIKEGFLDESEGSITEVKTPTGFSYMHIVSKPNRTRVGVRALETVETVGGIAAWAGAEKTKSNNDAATAQGATASKERVDLKKLDNEAIPLNAAAEETVIKAKK